MISLNKIKFFLKELGYSDSALKDLMEQIRFFEEEAAKRDVIIKEYFHEECLNAIINTVTEEILRHKTEVYNILDVGAGSGFFTDRIRRNLGNHGLIPKIYGLDITPSMLRELAKKDIIPIWGAADKIKESILLNNIHFGLEAPGKYDVIISTLALHHFHSPKSVLSSMKSVLNNEGLVIIVDILKHDNDGLHDKLRDIHLGFDTGDILDLASGLYHYVKVDRLDNVYCYVDGLKVGLFKAVMKHV